VKEKKNSSIISITIQITKGAERKQKLLVKSNKGSKGKNKMLRKKKKNVQNLLLQ
jgi:hypothetical protein